MSMKYVITGINRLTGDREAVSRAMEKEQAEATLRNVKAIGRRRRAAYTRLKVETAEKEMKIAWEE